MNLVVLIGSVRNTNRINSVSRVQTGSRFPCGSTKHVPLMEDSPNEAIKIM